MQPTKVFSFLSWIILSLLAIPTFLVLSSWNALPGDSLYGVKLGMENILLTLVSPSQSLSSNLSIKYSERRFIEANSLISEKHSIVGLASFEQQVQTTQQKIQNTADPKTQQDLKNQLVSNLQTYNQQLEETKTQVTTSNTINNVVTETPIAVVNNSATNTPTATMTPTPTVVIVTSTPTPKTETEVAKSVVTDAPVTATPIVTTSGAVQQSTNAQIVTAIDQTQEHITKTIKELEIKQKDNGAGNKKKD